MKREYIEREAAMNACKEAQIKGLPQWNSGLEDALERIKNLLAGDVEERKTAQWIPSDIPDSILDKCSECGFDLGANTFHYCPMCGAKMEELIKVEELEQGADPGYPPFGSFGDSVTSDEVVKQSKTTPDVQDVSSWPTANTTYGDNCWARLPCGICRNTMMNCPLSVMQPTWSCSSSTATNQTGGEA